MRFEAPRGFQAVHPSIRNDVWKGKELPRQKKSFSPEFKDEAVKMVIETSRPIARVAKELGINGVFRALCAPRHRKLPRGLCRQDFELPSFI
jgi:hypothetical protein